MITIKADFGHMDEHGRLLWADLVIHDQTPFAEIAARREPSSSPTERMSCAAHSRRTPHAVGSE